MQVSGYFITFEGTDGSGKTSVLNIIEEKLKQKNVDYLRTREPGGVPLAEKIRAVILDKDATEMDARTEALLYAAARRQHLVEKVLPALKEGKIVLCDRFVDSSLAYQGAGRGLGVENVAKINEFATEGLKPDLTFYLKIDPKIGLSRIQKNRTDEVNRLDNEDLSFYEKINDTYQELAKAEKRIKTIDASLPLEKVSDQVWEILETRCL